jgi:hypothetical protein
MRVMRLFGVMLAVILAGAISFGYGFSLIESGVVEVGKRFFLGGVLTFALSPLLICLADD